MALILEVGKPCPWCGGGVFGSAIREPRCRKDCDGSLWWIAVQRGAEVYRDERDRRYYNDQWNNRVYMPPLFGKASSNGQESNSESGNAFRSTSATVAEVTVVEPAADLFRRYTMTELLAMERTQKWLIRRMAIHPSYGQIAGEAKSLKSYLALMTWVGLASGSTVLDVFEVDREVPVVAYIGEGGRIPMTARLERVAAAMGVYLKDIPLEVSFDTAPISSMRFQETLERDLEEVQPELVGLDPLYAFHGTQVRAADLHQEGALLSSLSAPCMEAGASVWLVNHFNQTGTGNGLARITQAGSTEWVDSWVLVRHRQPPDVEHGHFRLTLDIGSRQWGGSAWDVDIELGIFNPDTLEYDGAIEWQTRRHEGGAEGDDDEARVLAQVAKMPNTLTKEELAQAAGGNLVRVRQVIDNLSARGDIEAFKATRKRTDGRPYPTWVYGPPSNIGRDETTDGNDAT